MEHVFTDLYARQEWGPGSGPGSAPAYCEAIVNFLGEYIDDNGLGSIVDMGCGDLAWMPTLLQVAPVDYVGIDCVADLIDAHRAKYPQRTFLHMDLASAPLTRVPDADLFLMKDVLQHWPSATIEAWLRRFFRAKPDAHLLVVNCNYQQGLRELEPGGFVPLSGAQYPLSLFAPESLFTWQTKTIYLLRG